MAQHVKILSILYLILGALGLLASLATLVTIAGAGIIGSASSGEAAPALVTGIVGTVIAGFVFLLSIPNIICGWAMLKHKEWGRVFGIILSVLNLLQLPLGTILGIYGLWVLLNDETVALFAKSRRTAGAVS